jgi:hypothetical protein
MVPPSFSKVSPQTFGGAVKGSINNGQMINKAKNRVVDPDSDLAFKVNPDTDPGF